MNYKLILSVILGALAFIFMIQNFDVINIRFLFWTISISNSLLMFLLLMLGFVLGRLLHNYSIHRSKK
jgi:uncharacterized integral membrane protein